MNPHPTPGDDLFATGTAPPLGETGSAPTGTFAARTDSTATPVLERIGDFVLLRELGRGAFARVYLAHQVTLDRKVALKLTSWPSRGEGQILAGLEHDHVVKVFAEFSDPATGQRGLVLQYVPGTNLARVLVEVFRAGPRPTTGQAVLDAVDRLASEGVGLDPAALRDREMYSQGGYAATVCRLAARLAEALAFAHARGILHCDVKPANILLNPYGRPLLVDFNVAVPSRSDSGAVAVGGTPLYMSPEQTAALVTAVEAPPVDHRTDLYALGLVVVEALAGRLPLPTSRCRGVAIDLNRNQAPEVWLGDIVGAIPAPAWRVLRRCLAPHPQDRYPDGLELAAALRRAADLIDAESRTAPRRPVSRFAFQFPILALLLVTFMPHVIGSLLNITYNAIELALTAEQADAFNTITLLYNMVVYPLGLAVSVAIYWPVAAAFLRPERLILFSNSNLDRIRSRARVLGRWSATVALLGWLPGGVIFPVAVQAAAGLLDNRTFAHFMLSFTLSGLIAVTYSYLGIQYVVLRSLYPRLLHPELSREGLRRELRGTQIGLTLIPLLAALVPLSGAILQVVFAPADLSLAFRLLVAGLIVAGMFGLVAVLGIAQRLRELILVMSGAPSQDSP